MPFHCGEGCPESGSAVPGPKRSSSSANQDRYRDCSAGASAAGICFGCRLETSATGFSAATSAALPGARATNGAPFGIVATTSSPAMIPTQVSPKISNSESAMVHWRARRIGLKLSACRGNRPGRDDLSSAGGTGTARTAASSASSVNTDGRRRSRNPSGKGTARNSASIFVIEFVIGMRHTTEATDRRSAFPSRDDRPPTAARWNT